MIAKGGKCGNGVDVVMGLIVFWDACRIEEEVTMEDAVREVVYGRKIVLISGEAGCGKTHFARHYVHRKLHELFRKELFQICCQLTAMTRIASHKLGGRTFHSWPGVGFGTGKAEDLAAKMPDDGVQAALVSMMCSSFLKYFAPGSFDTSMLGVQGEMEEDQSEGTEASYEVRCHV